MRIRFQHVLLMGLAAAAMSKFYNRYENEIISDMDVAWEKFKKARNYKKDESKYSSVNIDDVGDGVQGIIDETVDNVKEEFDKKFKENFFKSKNKDSSNTTFEYKGKKYNSFKEAIEDPSNLSIVEELLEEERKELKEAKDSSDNDSSDNNEENPDYS